MAKMVGLSRDLKLPWLNEVVRLYSEGLNENIIKEKLNEYLGFEINSPTNIRKTREILMNIWVYECDNTITLRDDGLKLIQMDSDYCLPVHWCMILATYPVFQDICRLIGKISEYEETITTKQIKQKLFDEWGERSTLYHSSDKLIATLKAMDVLQSEKVGVYSIKKHEVKGSEIINFIIFAMMHVDNKSYYPLGELEDSVYLFPFEFKINKEALLTDERFVVGTFGGETAISLR